MIYLKRKKDIIFLFIYVIIYTFLNTKWLSIYPFIHSDESWLSGLTREIMESNSFKSTESFFDIFPRNPHSIKIIFHYIQSKFIEILGYNINSVRLFSVLTGTLCILIFFFILKKINKENFFINIFYTIIFSLNIQFIYASRFARQEIQILLFILIVAFLMISILKNKTNSKKLLFIIPFIIGISIGFHPNSFIIALIFFFTGLYLVFLKKIELKSFIKSLLIIGIFASFFIILSFKMNPNFINDYLAFGKTLNVDANPINRFKNFIYFYTKLWNGISITYYVPNIKPILAGFFLLILSIPTIHRKYKPLFNLEIITIISINIGYFIIGRYSPLYIIFIIPSIYIMAYILTISIKNKIGQYSIISVLIFTTIFMIFINIKDLNYENYNSYIENIKKYTNSNDIVLCNLNGEFAFENRQIFDYRNLNYLNQNNLSIEDYIKKNNINKIILSEEMDYIYRNSPKWNYLYGDLSPYYLALKKYLDENAMEIGSFPSKTYGNRIVKYIDTYPWNIKVYEIK